MMEVVSSAVAIFTYETWDPNDPFNLQLSLRITL